MAAGTVYLDVDDEITSAAARIRSSETTKVGLVVPYGSRISTSRMNFRLLSREAIINNRRLSIIAADPATRALAASAGLLVFATVGEYESALAGPPAPVEDDDEPSIARAAFPEVDAAPIAATVAPAVPARSATAPAASRGSADLPVRGGVRRFRVRTPVLIGAVVVLLALAVASAGAYIVLPSADITVTPREEAIGPIPMTITADPDATAVDAANDIVPAVRLDIPVEVIDTFTTTGKRVERVPAKGSVTFTSENTFIDVTVPRGTRVGTTGGIDFTTNAQVIIPKASFATGPSHRDVGITAVKPGPAGNVEAGTITERPTDIRLLLVSVTNADPTTGGAQNEFPVVKRGEVDKALATLRTKVDAAFMAAVEAGAGAPDDTTLFPETAVLGEPNPTTDPAKIVGQEVATFDLGLAASGTVIAVDASPVSEIARSRLLASVGDGYRLVDGSDKVDQGQPVVTGGVVTFPVTVRATRVRILDAAALRALVKGKSTDEAKALLAPFGQVAISTWPTWVSSITGLDSRLSVKIGQEPGAGSTPSPSNRPSSGSPRPSSGGSPRASSAPAKSAAPASRSPAAATASAAP